MMNFMPILMDLIPVQPEVEAEIVKKSIIPAEASTALLAAGLGLLAVVLINFAIKKMKK